MDILHKYKMLLLATKLTTKFFRWVIEISRSRLYNTTIIYQSGQNNKIIRLRNSSDVKWK